MNKIRLAAVAVIFTTVCILISGHFGVRAQIKACFKEDTATQVVANCTSLLNRDDISDQTRAKTLFRRAIVSARQDHLKLAEADYLAVLEIRPDWTWPLNNLGLVYLNMDEPSRALPFFNRALEIEPDAHHRRVNRAEAYFDLQRYPEALADTEIIFASDPGNLNAQLVHGRSLGELSGYDAAIESYSKFIMLDSDNAAARVGRAMLYHEDLNLPFHAEVDLRHVLERNPDDLIASGVLGYVMLQLNRYADANDAFEHALVIKPDYAYARRGLTRVEREVAGEKEVNKILSSPTYLGRELAPSEFCTLFAEISADFGETAHDLADVQTFIAHLSTNNVFAHAEKARVYYDRGNDEAAIASIADFFAAVPTNEEDAKGCVGMIDQQHTRLGNSYHRLGNTEAALEAWQKGLANARANDVSLWQLRLQSAGHYSGWPDGEISDALMEGLAACASDLGCLNGTPHATR